MPARAGARDAEFVRVDAVLGGIVPHEPDCAVNVLLDFRNDKPRLRSVHDRKHRIAMLEQGAVESGIDGIVAGKEPAADHEENAATIRFLGLKYIERQRRADFRP